MIYIDLHDVSVEVQEQSSYCSMMYTQTMLHTSEVCVVNEADTQPYPPTT